MAGFDPDAYLAQAPSFDPDAYLKGASLSAKKQPLMRQDAPIGGASFDPNTGEVVIDDGSRGGQATGLDAYVRGLGSGLGNIFRSSGMKKQAEPFKEQFPIATGAGELTSELAVTAPVGGALAKGVTKAASYAPQIASKAAPFATALETGGLGAGAGGVGTRVAGGATLGTTQGALIDSESPAGAVGGAVLGGAIPAVGAAARPAAEWLMKSALKPTLAQHQSGEAASAVKTLLDEGINATKGGAEKLKSMVQDIDQQIKDVISSSTATVDKQKVLGQLQGLRQRVLQQANPAADLAAVEAAGTGFAQHPLLPTDQIPIQLAQDLKQGTYREVGKKYGQIGSADIEAQKALARGLKEEIAQVAPEVSPLNARQSELIKALKVTGRRALMDENKNPLGLTALAPSGTGALAFLADRSALAKSLAARGINQLSPKDKQSILADLLRQTTVTSPAMIASD